MKVGYVSAAYNCPDWSSCTFLGDGFKKLAEDEGFEIEVGRPGQVSDNCDIYIDVEGGHNARLDRNRFRPVVSLVMDIFDPELRDKKQKLEHARSADKVVVMSEVDKRFMEDNGIKVDAIVNWALHEEVWHSNYDVQKSTHTAFIGNTTRGMSSHRTKVIGALRSAGMGVCHRHMDCFLEDNARQLLEGAFGLNIPNMGFNSVNQRDTEIIGCELPLLTYNIDYFNYILPQHLYTAYTNESDVVSKANEVLENIEEKQDMARRMRAFFLDNHTYKHLAKRILSVIIDSERYDLDYYKELWNGKSY